MGLTIKPLAGDASRRPDAVALVGFASFLTVLDFLFWGAAFAKAFSHPFSSLEVIEFFAVPCFLVAGALLVARTASPAPADGARLRRRLSLASLVLLLAGSCALTVALSLGAPSFALLVAASLAIGAGLAEGLAAWGLVLARLGDARLVGVVGGACMLFPLFSVVVTVLPTPSSWLAIGALTCCSALMSWGWRDAGPRQGGASEAAGERAAGTSGDGAARAARGVGGLRAAWRAYGGATLEFAAFGFVAGFSRTMSLVGGVNGTVVTLGSPVFVFVAGAAVLALWRRGHAVTPGEFFRVGVVLAATGLVVFMVANLGFTTAFACFGNFFFEFMLVVVAIDSVRAGRAPGADRAADGEGAGGVEGACAAGDVGAEGRGDVREGAALSAFCLAIGVALLLAAVGTVVGLFAQLRWQGGNLGFFLTVVVCIYALAMALALQARRPSAGPSRVGAPDGGMPGRTGAGGGGVAPAQDVDDVMDGWSEKAARAYGLTPRERQILFLLLRGDDGPAIAEELGLSDNTVRSHKKRLYRKLDVHSKQELLELMRSL